jgi:hypothetical protein
MSYFPLTLRIFFFIVLIVLLDSALTFVLAHHCGPTQPLPEYPRHSCRTHTQTWQPGEAVDIHPGGAQGRGAAPAQGTGSNQSLHCQLINNKCVCGSIGYTGRNIPCRPEFTGQPQTQPAEPPSCPIDETLGASPGGGWTNNQSQSDWPSNQVRNRGSLLGRPSDPSLTPPCNWAEWMTNNVDKVPPGLRYVIWKAQNNEISKSTYNSNKSFAPGEIGDLPRGMKWKVWWSTNQVSFTVSLRCYAGRSDVRPTCTILDSQVPDGAYGRPNHAYLIFLKRKVVSPGLAIPVWPTNQEAPFPEGSQGLKYDQTQDIRYLDLPYAFRLQIGSPRSGQPW